MSISLLIKPASGACNLNCKYCFYKEFFQKRKNGAPIDIDKLIAFVNNVKSSFATNIDITFQGGEPLLCGIDFYQELLPKITAKNVTFSMQTNATLINEDWIRLFKKYDVLLGVSIDGEFCDNALRVFNNGEASFDKIVENIALLKRYGVNHNLVCVVSRHNVKRLGAVYDYFADTLQERFLQFIPCLKTSSSDLALTKEEYLSYLQTLFDKYFNDIINGRYVSIRYFDELINVINGHKSSQCGMNGRCERQLVIEADGNVYPCDFYCDDKYLLGNIASDNCLDLLYNAISDDFTKKEVMAKCRACKYYRLCQGGCKRQRQDCDCCESIYKFLDGNINKMLYISKITKECK